MIFDFKSSSDLITKVNTICGNPFELLNKLPNDRDLCYDDIDKNIEELSKLSAMYVHNAVFRGGSIWAVPPVCSLYMTASSNIMIHCDKKPGGTIQCVPNDNAMIKQTPIKNYYDIQTDVMHSGAYGFGLISGDRYTPHYVLNAIMTGYIRSFTIILLDSADELKWSDPFFGSKDDISEVVLYFTRRVKEYKDSVIGRQSVTAMETFQNNPITITAAIMAAFSKALGTMLPDNNLWKLIQIPGTVRDHIDVYYKSLLQ